MALFIPGQRPEQIPPDVWDFTYDRCVDISMDVLSHPGWVPELVVEDGASEIFVRKPGIAYFNARINYRKESIVQASRIITTLLAGAHTEATYWSRDAPSRSISVHKGMGALALGDPATNKAIVVPLHDRLTPAAIVEPGRMYMFEALPGVCPLVLSEYWDHPNPALTRFRTTVPEGAEQIRSHLDGMVAVPNGFPSEHHG